MMEWRYGEPFAKNESAATARLRLYAEDRQSVEPPLELIDATVLIEWQGHQTSEAVRKAALHRLQTLIWREINRLEGHPSDS